MNPEFVPSVRAQSIMGHELIGNLACKVPTEAAADVDPCQLRSLGLGCSRKFPALSRKIRAFCVRLGTNGNELTRRHRKSTGNEARDRGEENGLPSRLRGSHANNEAAR